jgi:hypothetical protein
LDSSIIQGPFSVAPCQKRPNLTTRDFFIAVRLRRAAARRELRRRRRQPRVSLARLRRQLLHLLPQLLHLLPQLLAHPLRPLQRRRLLPRGLRRRRRRRLQPPHALAHALVLERERRHLGLALRQLAGPRRNLVLRRRGSPLHDHTLRLGNGQLVGSGNPHRRQLVQFRAGFQRRLLRRGRLQPRRPHALARVGAVAHHLGVRLRQRRQHLLLPLQHLLQLLASLSELLASPSELLASLSERLASPSELVASLSEL